MSPYELSKIARNKGVNDSLACAQLENISKQFDSHNMNRRIQSERIEEILHIVSLHEPNGYEAFEAISNAITKASKTRPVHRITFGISKLYHEEVIMGDKMKLTLKGLETRIQDYILGMEHTPSGNVGRRRFIPEDESCSYENAVRNLEDSQV